LFDLIVGEMQRKENQEAESGKGGVARDECTLEKSPVDAHHIVRHINCDGNCDEPSQIDGRKDLQPVKDRKSCQIPLALAAKELL
jgi:hypothetical protein